MMGKRAMRQCFKSLTLKYVIDIFIGLMMVILTQKTIIFSCIAMGIVMVRIYDLFILHIYRKRYRLDRLNNGG